MAIQHPLPGFLSGDERRAALLNSSAALVEHRAVASRLRQIFGMTGQVNPQAFHQFELFGGSQLAQRNIHAHDMVSDDR